jgi:PAS domain S-box-containing protein
MQASPASGPVAHTEQVAFRRLLLRAILLPLLLMLTLAGVFLWQINRLLITVALVDHTDQVIAQANDTLRLLIDMETGMRGYLVAGNPIFLEPYTRASGEIEPAFTGLNQLAADDPAQQQRLAETHAIYLTWAQFARDAITLRQRGGDYAAFINSGLGKKRMDAMRAQFASLIKDEEALRNERTRATRQATVLAISTSIIFTLLLGVLLAITAGQQLTGVSRTYSRALAGERESRRLLETVTSNATLALFILNERQHCVYMNPAAEALTGFTLAEVQARPLHDFVHHQHPDGRPYPLADCPIDQAFPQNDQTQGQEVFVHKDGRFYPVAFTASPIRAGGQPVGTIVEVRDISAELRIESEREQLLARTQAARHTAEEASRLKDEFLATVSHELRTPMTAILGWAHLLRGNTLDKPNAQRALDTIERNANAQAQLIEDLLDVSRIITGKLRLDARPVELAPIIAAATDAARPAAAAKGITLQIDPGATDLAVLGDADRLQQVVWNLLSNAIKFTPQAGEVRVSLGRNAGQAEISVRDTGQGIAPDFLPHVFERFRQADGAPTRQHGGLGLGLAIVRHLVELHGGTVAAASAGVGHGATFTVQLPIAALRTADCGLRAGDGAADQSTVRDPQAAILSGLRVLVVDDEPDARDLLQLVLTQSGALVTTADSASTALAALARERPDLLISDIGMPGVDGYALMREVRARETQSGLTHLPAIALTAYARAEDRAQALAAGFHTHMPKPIEPAALVVALARFKTSKDEG